jgi:hypothetical protein
VATARHVITHDGRPVQFATLEDEDGLAEVTLFSGECPQVPYLTMGPYVAAGVVEEQHGVCTLAAKSFERVVELPPGPSAWEAMTPLRE